MRVRPLSTLGGVLSVLAFLPGVAFGQSDQTGSSSMAKDFEAIKAQLREELKAEIREELAAELKDDLKAEIKADLSAEGAGAPDAGGDDDWPEDEWKWEEPVKPELNFLEFDGYFRFRYDMFSNLDLGLYYQNTETGVSSGPFAPGYSPPVPLCNTDIRDRPASSDMETAQSCFNSAGASDTLGGANMRLRLEPVLNVYEDIKIKTQIDVLDNLVLGSTPDGFPNNPISPLLAFSQTQLTPVAGVNTPWTDSVRVKRVWGEVMTPLGQLRVGRMPSHFGMGMLANEGRGLDSDFGDSNDRIMFATRIGDFYVVPAYDWAVSGPTSQNIIDPYGQPFDRDQRDDVDQYIIAIAKKDKDDEIRQKLENDEWVLNYGTYQVGRFQALDAADYHNTGNPLDSATTDSALERDAQAYAYSYWAKFMWRKLTIEAEYAGILGRIGNSAVSGPYGATDAAHPNGLSIAQHGATLNVEYKLLRDALTLSLLVVVASGDSAPGWGIRPLVDASGTAGIWDGAQVLPGTDSQAEDRSLNNFRFDPDFIVDMIFWRQLVGTVTDALVIRPGVQYNVTEGLGARLDLVYSRAWFASSTPSGSFVDLQNSDGTDVPNLGTPSANLGVEADVKLFYASKEGFHAWLQYGLFIPFGGLDRQVEIEKDVAMDLSSNEVAVVDNTPFRRLDAKIAHTIQILFGITF